MRTSNPNLSTELLNGQGLGNQLWAYAATRSISERLGFGFILKGIDRFKGSDFLTLCEHDNIASEELELAFNTNYPAFHERQYFDPELNLFSTYFDDQVLGICGSHDLRGYFQSEAYFFGDVNKLRNYFKIHPHFLKKNTIDQDVCVLNLRGGEYKRFKDLILPLSYWHNAKNNIRELYGVNKFVVVTDDYRYAKALFPRYEIISGNIGDCYSVLNNAKYVIVSNSSFSYFPVKTSLNAPVVIAPQYWSRFNNKFCRWAAPANLYSGWLWQDANGKILSMSACEDSVQDTIKYYQANYYISCCPSQLKKKLELKKFIPKSFRTYTKLILSLFSPTKIG